MTNSQGPIKPKAYSYIRMSTDIQLKGDSRRRQLKLSQDFADQKSLDLVETLEDIGVSAYKGKNSKEGALARFLAAIEEGKISEGSYFLVESLDRVSRESVLDAFQLFSQILRKKIVIATLADNQIYTEDSFNKNSGQMFTTLGIMLRSNDESRMKSERLAAVWQHKRSGAAEKKLTSLCPAWLRLDRKVGKFVLVEPLATTVKKVFELSISGYGAGSICQLFNLDPQSYCPPNKTKGWHKSYIQKILASPAAFGSYQPHRYEGRTRIPEGKPVADYYPKIVTKPEFDLSLSRIEQRRVSGARRKGETFSNIFTRIIKCSGCGGVVVFRNRGDGSKGGRYLQCGNAVRRLQCNAPAWEYENFEKGFLNFVKEVDLEQILEGDKTRDARGQAQKELDLLERTQETLQTEYMKLIARLGSVDDAVAIDVVKVAKDRKIQIGKAAAEISTLRRYMSELDQKQTAKKLDENVAVLQKYSGNKSPEEIKAIRHSIYSAIRHMVSSVVVRNLCTYEPGDELSEQFIAKLRQKRYRTDQQQVDYLLTDAGQRFFVEHHREFTVNFRNGVTKLIRPATHAVIDFKSASV